MAIVTGLVTLILSAVGLWSAGTAVMDDRLCFGLVFNAALSYYPAVLVMIGLAALLVGLTPRLTSLAWYYLGFSFFAGTSDSPVGENVNSLRVYSGSPHRKYEYRSRSDIDGNRHGADGIGSNAV